MDALRPDFHALLWSLVSRQVRFVLIGGVAMAFHGSSHVTDDVDICYARDPHNLAALVDALSSHHPYLRGAPADLPFFWDVRTLKSGLNFTLTTDLGAIDLLGQVPGAPPFEAFWEQSIEINIGEMSLRIASLDDLIAMKEAAARPKDKTHLLELWALRRLAQDKQSQE